MKINKANSEAYTWGSNCKGWHLVNNKSLSVIQELMLPNTTETEHKHKNAQQFFFILKGIATFEINHTLIEVHAGEGVHIEPNSAHQIKNLSSENIEFLVISQPHAHGDRIVTKSLIKNKLPNSPS